MKRYNYIQFGALSILSHIAQGAAFILLFAAFGGTGSTSSFTFASPVGLVLGVVVWAVGVKDFPAHDWLNAAAAGIASGWAATGLNQSVKQLTKQK